MSNKAAYNRDSFIFYASFFQAIDVCPIENQRNIYRAIVAYALTGETPELEGIEKAVFLMAKPQIDSNTRRYLNGQKGAEHGKKGGAPKGNQNARKNKATLQMENNTEKPQTEKAQTTQKPTARFTPPTVDEVNAYIREKGYNVDAEEFLCFYESNGWLVGKNKMKNWRAAVTTWQKRKSNERTTTNGTSLRHTGEIAPKKRGFTSAWENEQREKAAARPRTEPDTRVLTT